MSRYLPIGMNSRAPSDARTERSAADGVRVLVVDDTPELREVNALILESAGHEVLVAAGAEEGLALAREQRPRVIVLDMMMPEMDGLEFLERLGREALDPGPTVIAASGFDAFEEAALARGAAVFLRKPLTPPALLAAVDRALRHAAVEPAALVTEAANAARTREEADAARRRIVASVDVRVPTLEPSIRALARWLVGYYGIADSFISLVGQDQVLHPIGTRPEGVVTTLDTPYCDDVVRAAVPFVVGDGATHPVYHHHPAVVAGMLPSMGRFPPMSVKICDRCGEDIEGEDEHQCNAAPVEPLDDAPTRPNTQSPEPEES